MKLPSALWLLVPTAFALLGGCTSADASGSNLSAVAAGITASTGPDAGAPSGGERCRPPGPPAEALQACAAHSAGDACTVSIGGKSLAGTCRAGPPGAPLSCAPAGGPPPGMMPPGLPPPPPEALAACTGHVDGDACSFTFQGMNLTGACRGGPNGEPAACAPPMGPPPGCLPPAPPPEAISACAAHADGDACSFSLGGHSLTGTCRAGPPGAPPACAPAGMPPAPPAGP